MKSILMSIQPKWVVKILNGEKTIEIRKRFPKDYRGWVYIYCTKGKDRLVRDLDENIAIDNNHYAYGDEELNGKVVARFYCDNVEEVKVDYLPDKNIVKKSGLTVTEIFDYIGHRKWCTVHISQLEIFDKPKELSEFKRYKRFDCYDSDFDSASAEYRQVRLYKAPQSWCYCEIEE